MKVVKEGTVFANMDGSLRNCINYLTDVYNSIPDHLKATATINFRDNSDFEIVHQDLKTFEQAMEEAQNLNNKD